MRFLAGVGVGLILGAMAHRWYVNAQAQQVQQRQAQVRLQNQQSFYQHLADAANPVLNPNGYIV